MTGFIAGILLAIIPTLLYLNKRDQYNQQVEYQKEKQLEHERRLERAKPTHLQQYILDQHYSEGMEALEQTGYELYLLQSQIPDKEELLEAEKNYLHECEQLRLSDPDAYAQHMRMHLDHPLIH